MSYLFVLITAFLLNPSEDFCSCLPVGEISEEKYDSYDLILKGRVEKAREEGKEVIYTVRVEKLYKGEGIQKDIEIRSHQYSSMCGIGFMPGQEWLIYGYKKENYFMTDLFTRSLRMDTERHRDRLNNDLSFLKKAGRIK